MSLFRRNRRGSTATTFVLILVPLLSFSALAVDVWYQKMVLAELQVACDAGAHAGSGYLDDTWSGMRMAIWGAVSVANANTHLTDREFTYEDVQVGFYEEGVFYPQTWTMNWDGSYSASIPVEDINAVRVSADHTVGTLLASMVLGQSTMEVAAESGATATEAPVRYVDCYLPFALPSCLFTQYDVDGDLRPDSNPPPYNFDFATSIEYAGFALPLDSDMSIGVSELNRQLGDECSGQTLDTIGMEMKVDNGAKTSVLAFMTDIINEKTNPPYPDPWPYDYFGYPYSRDGVTANYYTNSSISSFHWGNNIQGPVALLDMGDDCENLTFARDSWDIVGYSYIYIYDVGTPSDSDIWMQFDFVNDYGFGYGYDPDAIGNVVRPQPPTIAW